MRDPSRPRLEELDWQQTPMGELMLRRRVELVTGEDVYEVRLGEEYLMSSAFTVAERDLATRGLGVLTGEGLRVLVGGLGLGYTAAEALRDERVGELVVVEALGPVIDWHERRLLPVSDVVAGDPRCRMVQGDFFALARSGGLTTAAGGDAPYDAILLDVDHTPTHHLDPSHADLYTEEGLRRLRTALRPDGVFGLWSDESAGSGFLQVLRAVFTDVAEHEVTFDNPLTRGTSANTVYLARA